MSGKCTRPPEGWVCSRSVDHDGPCAAYPSDSVDAVLAEMRRMMPNACGDWADRIEAALAAPPPPPASDPAVEGECLTPGTTWQFHAYGKHGDYRNPDALRIEVALFPPDGKGGVPYDYPEWYKRDWYHRLSAEQVDELRDAVHAAVEPIVGRWQGNPAAIASPPSSDPAVERFRDAARGHGVAIRRKDDAPIPGEPLMSMDVAAEIHAALFPRHLWLDGETVKAVEEAARAWLAFKIARGLMNASIPATNATPAERYLYSERRIADASAEKEHHRTAIRLAQVAPTLLIAIRALAAQPSGSDGEAGK